jgi:hypothetical protein
MYTAATGDIKRKMTSAQVMTFVVVETEHSLYFLKR